MTPDNKEQTAEWHKTEWAKELFDSHKHSGTHAGDDPSWPWWSLDIGEKVAKLLSKEYQRGKRDELEAHRTSEAEAFEAGMRIAYETIVGVIQEELKKL